MTWTIRRILDWTTDYFKKFNIEWPHLEAEILLAHALSLKRIELYTKHERILTEKELACFKGLVKRRSQREPIAYITHNQPFMSLDFYVDRSVLIPRPETEKLVEEAVEEAKQRGPEPVIADIGTGCGCIAVSLATFLPQAKVIGTDSSPEALNIANRNAKHHQVDARCCFILGDMLDPLNEIAGIVVSNPPYIPTAEIEKLEPNVKEWEPRGALDGGQDGLDHIRKIIAEAPNHLKTQPRKGLLLIEIGYDQGNRAKILAEGTNKYHEIRIIKDLNGKDRILSARLL